MTRRIRARATRAGWALALLPLAALGLAAGCGFGTAAKGIDHPDLEDPPVVQPMPDLVTPPPPPDFAVVRPPDLYQPPPPPPPPDMTPPEPAVGNPFNDPLLKSRVTDYGLALRTAALKLLGELPTLAEQQTLATYTAKIDPNDPATEVAAYNYYKGQIDLYMKDPRFTRQMVYFFRNIFRAGGPSPGAPLPGLDTAAGYAASVVVADAPYAQLVTGQTNTCPVVTFANSMFTITPAACANGLASKDMAGVLTDPGIMALNYSNMAFRRARWIQETFACSHFPAEFRSPPANLPGGAIYTSPWDIATIGTGFQASDPLVCANCHGTINHMAPLFAYFGTDGKVSNMVQVMTPGAGTLTVSVMSDWLTNGQSPAWRFGGPSTPSILDLGKQVASDPAFATCIATRVWDWAMSKGDAIDEVPLPPDVVNPIIEAMKARDNMGVQLKDANGIPVYKVKAGITAAFLSNDFRKF